MSTPKLSTALARMRLLAAASLPVPTRETASRDTAPWGETQEPSGFHESVPTVPTAPTERIALPKIFPCGTAVSAESPSLSSKSVGAGRDGKDSQELRGFEAPLPRGDGVGTIGTPIPPRPWTEDRAWISEVAQAKTDDERLSVLFWWVLAAGGWISGSTALLPPLPHRLAALELRRMLRQSGIVISDEAP